MTYELALTLAQTETPEQMAGRIVELYEKIEEQAADIKQLLYDSWHRPQSGHCATEVQTDRDTNLPQSAATDAQPIIRLEYTDRMEAIRALRVGDYADALEGIQGAIRYHLEYEDWSVETTHVVDILWGVFCNYTKDLPEEL